MTKEEAIAENICIAATKKDIIAQFLLGKKILVGNYGAAPNSQILFAFVEHGNSEFQNTPHYGNEVFKSFSILPFSKYWAIQSVRNFYSNGKEFRIGLDIIDECKISAKEFDIILYNTFLSCEDYEDRS